MAGSGAWGGEGPGGGPPSSPGFRDAGDTEPSYELKHLIDRERAAGILAWARERLEPDPWGDPTAGRTYLVHTLYLDTPALDVYLRSESFRRRKFRVRRYGDETLLHCEQKTRSGDRVAKRRTVIDPADLESVALAASRGEPVRSWDWFGRRVRVRGLVPATRVTYVRSAFVARGPDGPLRLTLDDGIVAAPEDRWMVTSAAGGVPLLAGRMVLELKYRGTMPLPFKELMMRFGLTPASLSKYRNAVSALGLDRRGAAPREGR